MPSAAPRTSERISPPADSNKPNFREDEPLLITKTDLPLIVIYLGVHFQLRTSGISSPCSQT